MGLAFLAGHMGGVLQAAIAVTSSVAGPMLACFIMALFLPFTNYKVRYPRQISPSVLLSLPPYTRKATGKFVVLYIVYRTESSTTLLHESKYILLKRIE